VRSLSGTKIVFARSGPREVSIVAASKDVAAVRQWKVDAGLLQPLRHRRCGLAWIDLKIHRQVHPSDDVFPGDWYSVEDLAAVEHLRTVRTVLLCELPQSSELVFVAGHAVRSRLCRPESCLPRQIEPVPVTGLRVGKRGTQLGCDAGIQSASRR
jgi:hypothetical protein